MLVTLYKISEVYFRFLGVNGFHVKASKDVRHDYVPQSTNQIIVCGVALIVAVVISPQR